MKKAKIILFFILFFLGYVYGGYNVITNFCFTAEVNVGLKKGTLKHNPINEVNIIGDQIVLKVSLSEGVSHYTNLILYYRRKGESEYKNVKFSPRIETNISEYNGEAIIPSGIMTREGIEYYIVGESAAGENWYYKNSSEPEKIGYIEKKSIKYNNNYNSIELNDGNPYDGNASISIKNYPAGEEIYFSQIIDIDNIKENTNKNVISKRPVICYKIEPVNRVLKDACNATFLYFDIEQDGAEDRTGISEKKLRVYWYDGFEWRYIGGNINTEKNTISCNIFTFGIFGIFPVSKEVKIEEFKPKEKILTINNDGLNDYLIFSGLTGEFEIRIIDINGSLIRVIKDVPYWDGKDMEGNKVPSGVYLYQVKIGDQILRGVCVIAK